VKITLQILRRVFNKKLRYTHLMAFIKYNSLPKLFNFIINEYERRIKRVKLSSKPYLINSEPTNHCNFKCPFCPTGKNYKRTGGFAQIELYEKIFKQIGRYIYLITIHGWGEPLLFKNLPEIVKLAHNNKIFTVVTTNGSLLTKKMSRKIISSKLDYLILSIDGISEETYQKYRIGGSYNAILTNLKYLISLKKEQGSSTPFIEWQFLVFKHNEHEIDSAKKLASELGLDNIVFMPAYTEDVCFDSTDEKFHLPRHSPLSKQSDCKHLWSTLTYHWNGKVVPCCYDFFGKISYGNLHNERFGQIWNNEYFLESRRVIKNGPEGRSQDLFCSFCVRNIAQAP